MTPEATSTAAAARSLAELVSRIHARGWCSGTAGNFSVCVKRDPVRLLITPSGLDQGKLTPDDLLLVGEHGEPLDGAAGKPSAETALHLAVREASGASAILHTHSVWNTLLGEHFLPRGELRLTGYEMLKGIEGRHYDPRYRFGNKRQPAVKTFVFRSVEDTSEEILELWRV